MTLPMPPPFTVDNISHAEAVALLNQLAERVLALEKEVPALKARLAKDSHNSSKPPSSDGLKRRTRSLRVKSGAAPGGQVGHPGAALKKSERVDHVIVHPLPAACTVCGASLADLPSTQEAQTRQVIDLPAIRFTVTEHRLLRTQCRCGAQHSSCFPSDVASAVQYGSAVRAAVVYFTQYHHVPFQRCADLMRDLFGIALSPASIVNHVQQACRQVTPQVARIGEALTQQRLVHFDETGLHCGRHRLMWLHVASTATLTWYGVHAQRGPQAMTSLNILPRFHGVAVHDGWQGYRQYDCQHALCNAHHLRELKHLAETTGQTWADSMMTLLCDAKKEVDLARQQDVALSPARQSAVRNHYLLLLARGAADNPQQFAPVDFTVRRKRVAQSAGYKLVDRLYRYADDVLRFVFDADTPFDNNQAERDIRMVKLKQKVSGGFRTLDGVNAFCILRSYLSTLRKAKRNLYQALVDVFNGAPPAAV